MQKGTLIRLNANAAEWIENERNTHGDLWIITECDVKYDLFGAKSVATGRIYAWYRREFDVHA